MKYPPSEIYDQARYFLSQSFKPILKESELDEKLKKLYDDSVCYLDRIEKMYSSEKEYVISFAGITNVGKSTLLNAIMGDVIAPTSNRTWSAVPIEYMKGDGCRCVLSYRNNFIKKTMNFEDSDSMLGYLTQHGTIEQAESETLESIQVFYPGHIFDKVIISDTPGFGAAIASSDTENLETGLHDELLVNYLSKRPNRIFWIVQTENGNPIGESDVNFFKKHLSNICSDMIVNYREELNEGDKTKFKRPLLKTINNHLNFHFVNAKKALQSRNSADEVERKRSGIISIIDLIKNSIDISKKSELFCNEIYNIFENTKEYITKNNFVQPPWVVTELENLAYMMGENHTKEFSLKFLSLFYKDR